MNPYHPRVSQRAGHRCEYCHAPQAIFNFPFEVEHVIPTSRDGSHDESNLALACRSCNLFKSDHLISYDDTTDCEAKLFHPRQDQWDDHFEVDEQSSAIQGNTPVGRVTVKVLQFNSEGQMAARKQWMRLGLFP